MRVTIIQTNTTFTFAVPLNRQCCLEILTVTLLTENAGPLVNFSQLTPLIVEVDENQIILQIEAAQPITPGSYILGFEANGCGEVIPFNVEVQVLA